MGNVATLAAHVNQPEAEQSCPQVSKVRKAATYTLDQACSTASGLVSVALAATGLSRRATADGSGVNRNLVDHWASADHPRTMPLGRILALGMTSRRGREAAIAILAGALSHVKSVVSDVVPDRDLRGLVDDLHAEVGDLASEWRAAMRDGVVTAEERKTLAKEVADIERVLAALRHELAKGNP